MRVGNYGQGRASIGHGLTGAVLLQMLKHELAVGTFHEALMVAVEDHPATAWKLCARLLACRQRSFKRWTSHVAQTWAVPIVVLDAAELVS